MPAKTKGGPIAAPRRCSASLPCVGGSLPRDDDEFSALFDYLRRHTPTAEERARLKTTADVLEREVLIDRLAQHACNWLRRRVHDLVHREVADLLDIPQWELARMVQGRRWMR